MKRNKEVEIRVVLRVPASATRASAIKAARFVLQGGRTIAFWGDSDPTGYRVKSVSRA